MEWPASFYELRSGRGCQMCAEGRPEESGDGVRFYAGEVADAYLRRAAIQRGLSIVVWRGPHVTEPTELADEQAAAFWREVLLVGRAIERAFEPVKLNYNLLGNSLPHMHFHVVPRYADDPRRGGPFRSPRWTRPSSRSRSSGETSTPCDRSSDRQVPPHRRRRHRAPRPGRERRRGGVRRRRTNVLGDPSTQA
ncbi:MAG: HIT family protein [Actinomycetota bacterium]|nr:HIT family protein [Actinomycetota bacterium]